MLCLCHVCIDIFDDCFVFKQKTAYDVRISDWSSDVCSSALVRDPALHQEVCARIEGWVDAQLGWRVEGIVESPITGPEGNREFLLVARKILLPSWEKVAKA